MKNKDNSLFYNLRVVLFSPIKRLIDIFSSLILLIVFSPILIITSILIKLSSPGPIIFKQKRVGQNGEFFMYKFRSMRVGDMDKYLKDNYPDLWKKYKKNDWKLSAEEDPRITKIGRFIRSTSIDEMPQFINVLKGEMSIIGPRPEILSITSKYSDAHKEVFKYMPGITGYSQINGRQMLTPDQRTKMEIDYYNNETFWGDFKILFKTFFVVISNEGNI